mgnify:CR=1 FL=1
MHVAAAVSVLPGAHSSECCFFFVCCLLLLLLLLLVSTGWTLLRLRVVGSSPRSQILASLAPWAVRAR